jgi:hemoglobin
MADTADGGQDTLYSAVGGEQVIRRIVRRFYALMDELPEAKACRDVHPPSLEGSEQKLFEYLSGWLGGPQLYVAKYGHPMLRRRHFIAPIGAREREGWLLCFETALVECVEEEALRNAILQPIRRLAAHMQNTH